MEENDHRNGERQEDSGEESNRALLPFLQAPGNQQPHRVTNFYIDNILRPDFGRRKNGTFNSEENHLGVIRRENPLTRRAPKTDSQEQQQQQQGGAGEEGREEDTRPAREAKKADIVAGDAPLKPSGDSGDQCLSSDSDSSSQASSTPSSKPMLWPAWVYCTRYSDRPSSGPRSRKPKKTATPPSKDDKRPRTAFTAEQLQRLKTEFQTNRYLTEQRRQSLAQELGLNESQIKIWFQNKRAKIKKAAGNKNALALHLMAQGLYNHSTTAKDDKSDSE